MCEFYRERAVYLKISSTPLLRQTSTSRLLNNTETDTNNMVEKATTIRAHRRLDVWTH
jgi:hypothetical protein